ncbi:S8/S53 family peptidase, partial [Candidatus Bathyarchaeota archaeon]|nr:S8/S53 family peptidase [Candidatus Bathyarchaeota archaeon]
SVYSDPQEGHATMVAVTAAGNIAEGSPFNGIAPSSKIVFARITNKSGELVYIPEAWDWLVKFIIEEGMTDIPFIVNNSFGYASCRGPRLYFSTETYMVKATLRVLPNISSVYAAGNEALRCGHRLSGITNSITAFASIEEAYTIGALRSDLREVQTYSSHGFGQEFQLTRDKTDFKMKPDFVMPIPEILPYGCEVKDMSGRIPGSSYGGTSDAAPIFTGLLALIKSVIGVVNDFKLKKKLYKIAKLPRRTQVNIFLGFDARFGRGYITGKKILEEVV